MQKMENIWDNENLVNVLQQGAIAVMPTDTVYGIVAKAEDVLAVDSVYQARKRSPEKPCIVIIGSVNELEKFSIMLTK
jgi:L-threonylcarbamoyladenylate synthase